MATEWASLAVAATAAAIRPMPKPTGTDVSEKIEGLSSASLRTCHSKLQLNPLLSGDVLTYIRSWLIWIVVKRTISTTTL